MKALHYVNSALWVVNAVVWTFYAGSLFMGFASTITAAITGYIGWKDE